MSKLSTARFGELLEVMSDQEQRDFEDRAYTAWMNKVNAAFAARLGVMSRDLPDFGYRSMFDEGASPSEAVTAWVEEYGEEFGLDPDDDDFE